MFVLGVWHGQWRAVKGPQRGHLLSRLLFQECLMCGWRFYVWNGALTSVYCQVANRGSANILLSVVFLLDVLNDRDAKIPTWPLGSNGNLNLFFLLFGSERRWWGTGITAFFFHPTLSVLAVCFFFCAQQQKQIGVSSRHKNCQSLDSVWSGHMLGLSRCNHQHQPRDILFSSLSFCFQYLFLFMCTFLSCPQLKTS